MHIIEPRLFESNLRHLRLISHEEIDSYAKACSLSPQESHTLPLMFKLLEGINTNITLLRQLETRFKTFLNQHCAEEEIRLKLYQGNYFKHWYVDERMGFPYCLPIPSIPLIQYINTNKQFDTENIVLLFFYQMLTKAGVLKKEKPVDQQIVYLLDIIDETTLTDYFLTGHLFIDRFDNGLEQTHGAMIHLLQIVLLVIAYEQKSLETKIPPSQWLEFFSRCNNNVWNLLFEGVEPRVLNGPAATNTIFYSTIGQTYCPTFTRYWSYLYCHSCLIGIPKKKCITQRQRSWLGSSTNEVVIESTPLELQQRIEQRTSSRVTNIFNNTGPGYEEFDKQYQVNWVNETEARQPMDAKNKMIYTVQLRSERFRQIEAAIIRSGVA